MIWPPVPVDGIKLVFVGTLEYPIPYKVLPYVITYEHPISETIAEKLSYYASLYIYMFFDDITNWEKNDVASLSTWSWPTGCIYCVVDTTNYIDDLYGSIIPLSIVLYIFIT